jgi:hypothetical protein
VPPQLQPILHIDLSLGCLESTQSWFLPTKEDQDEKRLRGIAPIVFRFMLYSQLLAIARQFIS